MPPRGRPRKDGQPIRQKTPQVSAAVDKKKTAKVPERPFKKNAMRKRPLSPLEMEIKVAVSDDHDELAGSIVPTGKTKSHANASKASRNAGSLAEREPSSPSFLAQQAAPSDTSMLAVQLPDGNLVVPEDVHSITHKDSPAAVETAALNTTAAPQRQPLYGHGRVGRPPAHARNSLGGGYTAASVDLDAITYRQLSEDIDAYMVDLEFCDSQLAMGDGLTPQETRTLQLRRLDLSHQIRFSQHRKESLEARRLVSGGRPFSRPSVAAAAAAGGSSGAAQSGNVASFLPLNFEPSAGGSTHGRYAVTKNGLKRMQSSMAEDRNLAPNKRGRAVSELSLQDTISVHSGDSLNGANGRSGGNQSFDDGASDIEMVDKHNNSTMISIGNGYGGGGNGSAFEDGNQLQRLGFWKCRLCVSEKYMFAGPDRQPSAPSKWPLKDMGKLMSHYFDMHTEHDPDERLAELGAALDNNRGPFEYWLRKSRAQKITDLSVIDDTIVQLHSGHVPPLLRNLCRAAAAFPSC